MPHQRQLIREAVRKRLIDAGIVATGKVHESRTIAWRPRDLPALAVYALSETVDPASYDTAPRELKRILVLAVEGAVYGVSDIDDLMDELSLKVERAMHSEETFGNLCADTTLASTDIEIFEDGDKYIGVVRLNWNVTYYEFAPKDEDANLADFLEADMRYNLGGTQHEDNEAHDNVTLPGAS